MAIKQSNENLRKREVKYPENNWDDYTNPVQQRIKVEMEFQVGYTRTRGTN